MTTTPHQDYDRRSVTSLLTSLTDERVVEARPNKIIMPTGMDPLDQVLDGGLRPHDLILIGGQPGIGKTIATLQWARHIAVNGGRALYVCYEHDHGDLMARLLSLELGMVATDEQIVDVDKLSMSLARAAAGLEDFQSLLDREPLARTVYENVQEYADRLQLIRASGRYTTIDSLEQIVASDERSATTLFVDYLQKIPVIPEPPNETEKVTHAAEGLKEIALNHDVAVVAVVAAASTGLETQRLRLHHLRGSSALAYESDVVILLNEKHRIVAKAHLYDPLRAATYHREVIFSVDKNRHGAGLIDMEFRKDFARYRFDPRGGFPAERLVDERIVEE